jgi:hypothetical protein
MQYIFQFISVDYMYLYFNEYSNVSVYRDYIWFSKIGLKRSASWKKFFFPTFL